MNAVLFSSPAVTGGAAGTGAQAPTGTWEAWVQVLEVAVADYDQQLQAHRQAPPGCGEAPTFTPVPAPDGALPDALAGRTRAVLDGLERLTLATQERRDVLAHQLAALPRPKGRRPGAYADHELGGSFDAVG